MGPHTLLPAGEEKKNPFHTSTEPETNDINLSLLATSDSSDMDRTDEAIGYTYTDGNQFVASYLIVRSSQYRLNFVLMRFDRQNIAHIFCTTSSWFFFF